MSRTEEQVRATEWTHNEEGRQHDANYGTVAQADNDHNLPKPRTQVRLMADGDRCLCVDGLTSNVRALELLESKFRLERWRSVLGVFEDSQRAGGARARGVRGHGERCVGLWVRGQGRGREDMGERERKKNNGQRQEKQELSPCSVQWRRPSQADRLTTVARVGRAWWRRAGVS